MRPRDALELVALAALWGGAFLFMRVAVPEFGPLPMILLRVGVAALLLLALLAARSGLRALASHAAPLAFVGVVNSAIPFALFGYALLSISAGLASVLNATSPMFAALIARLWFGERLSAGRWLGLVVGFSGVVILVHDRLVPAPGAAASTLEVGLAILASLGGALCYGIAAGYTRRRLGGVDPMAVATGSQSFAALALLVPAALSWPAQAPSPQGWAAVLVLGVACTGLAYLLYFRLIRNIGPSGAISVTFLIPAFGMLFGVLFLGESVSVAMLAGSAVVVAGTAMATGFVTPAWPLRGRTRSRD